MRCCRACAMYLAFILYFSFSLPTTLSEFVCSQSDCTTGVDKLKAWISSYSS